MRHFYIIFLLSLPFSAEATTRTAPDSSFVSESSFLAKKEGEKRGLFKRFAEKTLLKRLKKAATLSGDGDGKWLAILGLSIGTLGILSWFVNPYLGLIVSIPFGLLGILLCIISLKKSRNYYDRGAIKGLAIAGLVVNGLLAVGLLLAITVFSS